MKLSNIDEAEHLLYAYRVLKNATTIEIKEKNKGWIRYNIEKEKCKAVPSSLLKKIIASLIGRYEGRFRELGIEIDNHEKKS